jgi:hypothetical protein
MMSRRNFFGMLVGAAAIPSFGRGHQKKEPAPGQMGPVPVTIKIDPSSLSEEQRRELLAAFEEATLL